MGWVLTWYWREPPCSWSVFRLQWSLGLCVCPHLGFTSPKSPVMQVCYLWLHLSWEYFMRQFARCFLLFAQGRGGQGSLSNYWIERLGQRISCHPCPPSCQRKSIWLLGGQYATVWDLCLLRSCRRLSRCSSTLMKQHETNPSASTAQGINHRRSGEWWYHHRDSPSGISISWWLSWWAPPQIPPAGAGVGCGTSHCKGLARLSMGKQVWGRDPKRWGQEWVGRLDWRGCVLVPGQWLDLFALPDRSVSLVPLSPKHKPVKIWKNKDISKITLPSACSEIPRWECDLCCKWLITEGLRGEMWHWQMSEINWKGHLHWLGLFMLCCRSYHFQGSCPGTCRELLFFRSLNVHIKNLN